MMGSSTNKHRPTTTTTTKLPSQNPSISSDAEDRNPNPNFELNFMETEVTAISPLTIDGAKEDSILQNSKFLTREQVIRRRSLRLKQLEKFYRHHYWALMEDLRVKHREYYWKYGMSPFEEEGETGNGGVNVNGVIEGTGENNNNSRLGFGENGSCDGKNTECAFAGCKSKPMALTTYCHSHILSDTKQKLYTACTYIIKSAQTGPVHCGKPILRTTVPSLCTDHYRKAQKHVTQALKMAGLNISSSSKVAPKFHVIVAESVRQINAKRRKCRSNIANAVIKEEIVG